MNISNQEIELRLEITQEEVSAVETVLDSAVGSTVNEQWDVYYEPEGHVWTREDPVKKWLRLRHSTSGGQLTFKVFSFDAVGKTTGCQEIEFDVSDSEQADRLLYLLDYRQVISVRKLRRGCNYDDAMLYLDRVEGLGYFVELEARESHGDYEDTIAHLRTLAEQLGLNGKTPDTRGYPYQLLRKAHNH